MHNILVSKPKILLMQEDLPPTVGDYKSCEQMTARSLERIFFYYKKIFSGRILFWDWKIVFLSEHITFLKISVSQFLRHFQKKPFQLTFESKLEYFSLLNVATNPSFNH